MKSKTVICKEWILELLEKGELKGGDKLPGARVLAEKFNLKLPQIQMVIDDLAKEGILEKVSRSGTFVQKNWDMRIISSTFAFSNFHKIYEELSDIVKTKTDDIYVKKPMTMATYELQVTHRLLSHHNEYMDLMPIFKELFANKDYYFCNQIEPFIINGKLCGIPLIFSPRILLFNRKMFKKYNCPEPQENWTWDDFLKTIIYLKKHLDGENIFYWSFLLYEFMSVVIRAGGGILSSDGEVILDSPESINGFKKYAQLREILEYEYSDDIDKSTELFKDGKLAMIFAPRQFLASFDSSKIDFEIGGVGIPNFNQEQQFNMMAGDLFCIRKECTDMAQAKQLIKLLFSEDVQYFLGKSKNGIPFLKSAAMRSMDTGSILDFRYMAEIPKIVLEYNIFSPELYDIISHGLAEICLQNNDDIDSNLKQLASVIRVLVKIKKNKQKKGEYIQQSNQLQEVSVI